MALPKWNEERTQKLVEFVGDESPVTQKTVAEAAETLETTTRSISSKLRKMGYDVEMASASHSKAFTEEQEEVLRTFVEENSGKYTYAEIADLFANGEFSAKRLQGKILSMELTEHVRKAPKPETTRTYTEDEEKTFVEMATSGASVEALAEALSKSVASIRGKALSLLRSGDIEKIPHQDNVKGDSKVDPLEALKNIAEMTVSEIAEAIEKTPRGVKTMLTRRGIKVADYDGAAKKEKAAAK